MAFGHMAFGHICNFASLITYPLAGAKAVNIWPSAICNFASLITYPSPDVDCLWLERQRKEAAPRPLAKQELLL
jgi:hypothetical protein